VWTAFRRTPSDARKASFLFDRCDRRLGLQFDDPKVKPRAEVLLPAHEPTGTRFVGVIEFRIVSQSPKLAVCRCTA
jgi:hypothetical protein